MDEEAKKDTVKIESYTSGMIHKQIGNGVPTSPSANASSTNANVGSGGTLLKAITKRERTSIQVNDSPWWYKRLPSHLRGG